MKFFEMTEKEAISSMSDRRKGCFPMGDTGIWHAGQHVYFQEENRMVKNPVTGSMVSGNFSNSKKWNYIVLENKVLLPEEEKKGTAFQCYNIISNLRAKNDYDDFFDTKNEITSENLEKIRELPFYIQAEITFPQNTCSDKHNFKSFYSNLSKTVLRENLNTETLIRDISEGDLSDADNFYYIKSGCQVYATKTEKLGTVNNDIAINKRDAIIIGNVAKISCKGSEVKLENIPKGLYVFGQEEKVTEYGNARLTDRTRLFLWDEQEKSTTYPGFGIVIDKKNDNATKIISDNRFSDGMNECKQQLQNLLNSIDEETGCIYVTAKAEGKSVFPYYLTDATTESYKITDRTGKIIKPLEVNESDYKVLKKILTGLFKYTDDWYKTAKELWIASGLTCTRLKKNNISAQYGNLFNGVKLLAESGTGYTKYDTKIPVGLFAKVQAHCFEKDSYELYISKDRLHIRVRNISDTKGENMYRFASEAEIKNGVPAADTLGAASGTVIVDNMPEIAERIKNKADYLWVCSRGNYIFVTLSAVKLLKVNLVKKEPVKGDVIPIGAKLGFAYNGLEKKAGVVSEVKPYVDYALFFTEDITTKQTPLEKIDLAKDTPCVKEVVTIKETTAQIIIPSGATLVQKAIEGQSGYCELEKISFTVIAYPAQVKNRKLAENATKIWLFNFPVELKDGKFSAVGKEYSENSNTEALQERIDLIQALVDTDILEKIKEKTLQDGKDRAGDPVYEAVIEKTYNKIIKTGIEKSRICQYVKTCTKEITDEATKLPVAYSRIAVGSSATTTIKNGKPCVKITTSGGVFFVEEKIVKEHTKNLLSEFMEDCQTVNFGKSAIAGKEICPQDKLYIEQNNERHNMDAFKKKLRERLATIKDEQGQTLENCIEKENSPSLYKEGTAYQRLMHNYFKKTVSKHPMEWDENLLKEAAETRGMAGFNSEEDNDIFKEFSAATGIKENSFYFASPTRFYTLMDELGLMFKNPYEGKENLKTRAIEPENEERLVSVNSNPGFAPGYTGNNRDKTRFPDTLKEGNIYWAAVNYVYGYSYGYFKNTKEHIGIDLAGNEGTPIYALIYGTVWACTWEGSIQENSTGRGRMMVIKGYNDRLYLLCHLSAYGKEVGEEVLPMDVVAYVGSTGKSSASHLHLEVYVCPFEDKALVLDTSKNNKHTADGGSGEGFVWGVKFVTKEENNPFFKTLRRDPFNHEK